MYIYMQTEELHHHHHHQQQQQQNHQQQLAIKKCTAVVYSGIEVSTYAAAKKAVGKAGLGTTP